MNREKFVFFPLGKIGIEPIENSAHKAEFLALEKP